MACGCPGKSLDWEQRGRGGSRAPWRASSLFSPHALSYVPPEAGLRLIPTSRVNGPTCGPKETVFSFSLDLVTRGLQLAENAPRHAHTRPWPLRTSPTL